MTAPGTALPDDDKPFKPFSMDDEYTELAFDLGKFGPSGIVPEPSQLLIDAWRAEMTTITAEARIDVPDDAKPAEIAALVADKSKLSPEINARAIAAYARLCGGKVTTKTVNRKKVDVWEGGCPTHDELAALPARPANLFFGWLAGALSPNG